MKNLLAFLVFFLAGCSLASAQTTVLPFAPLDGAVQSVPLVVPPGAVRCTVAVTINYAEFYGLENTAPFAQHVVQQSVAHVSAKVAWNAQDFFVPSPYAPFLNDGFYIYRSRDVLLDAFDGAIDYVGTSGSGSQYQSQYAYQAHDSTTFPVALLQEPRLYVQLTGERQFGRVQGIDVGFNSSASVTVSVTYR
jgi:hypothetical protein